MTNTGTATAPVISITTNTHRHGWTETRVEYAAPGARGRFVGIASHLPCGSSYLVLDRRTGRNAHPGTRVEHGRSVGEFLAAMVDEVITFTDAV